MGDVAEYIPGPIGDAVSGKKAKKSNQKNINYIKSLFADAMGEGKGLYDSALGQLDNAGVAAKNNALSQERQFLSGAQQNLVNTGLWGSTAGQAAQRGIHSDTLRTLGGIDNQIAMMRAGLLTGKAGFGLQGAQGLGSILGGVQYQGSQTTADLMGMMLGMGGLFGGKGG